MALCHLSPYKLVRRVPKSSLSRMVLLPDQARKVFISGSSGSGKTTLMALIIWGDFANKVLTVVLDPLGGLIDAFLGKFLRQPVEWQREQVHRIRYVDLSGRMGFVTPIPLYYRMGGESLAEIARRPIDTFLKLDPELMSASILGANALISVGTQFGMVATALGLQVTEAESLLGNPRAWEAQVSKALGQYPELEGPVGFIKKLARSPKDFERQTGSFFAKLQQFTLDPFMRAQWCANTPGIDWVQAESEKWIVLLDARKVHGALPRMFSMMFALNFLLDYVKERGVGRHEPISLAIDELTALFPVVGKAADQFRADIDALINQYMRSHQLWGLLSTQELYQFPERLAKTLLSMPSQCHFGTSDPGAAEILARKFYPYDPYQVKKTVPQYMSSGLGSVFIVQHLTEEFTMEEQLNLGSQDFMKLKPFQFMARLPGQEGSQLGLLQKVSIANIDPGLFPGHQMVAEARELLVQRYGRPIAEVQAEIVDRRPQGSGEYGDFSGWTVHQDQTDDIPGSITTDA